MSSSSSLAMTETELRLLEQAKQDLEKPDLAARLSAFIGAPIERGMHMLPAPANRLIEDATRTALHAAVRSALYTLRSEAPRRSRERLHKLAAAAAGGLGGVAGIVGVGVELPLTTTILLRSILEIAREQGEPLDSPEAQLASLQVLALGGRSLSDDATETGYYTTRVAMAHLVSQTADYLGRYGVKSAMADGGAPLMAKLIAKVASRFSPAVMQKIAAAAVPIVGAATGASINLLFADHFQRVGRAHFVVRRLERTYGRHVVAKAYEAL